MRRTTAALLAIAWAAAAQEASSEDVPRKLEAALRDGGEEERIEAIRGASRVADDGVARLLAKAMRDPARAVRREAIDALGWNAAPEALKALTQEYWKNTALRDDAELFALLLKAIGRHADPKSIVVLVDTPFQKLTLANGTARLMGLGNIRETGSDRKSTRTILDDGTIKTSSNKVSMPNHANADQFLRDIARLADGEVTRQKKSGTKGHVHAGVYHEHQPKLPIPISGK